MNERIETSTQEWKDKREEFRKMGIEKLETADEFIVITINDGKYHANSLVTESNVTGWIKKLKEAINGIVGGL